MPEQNLPKTAYDSARSAAVYDQLAADAETLLRTKAVVIADATFLQAEGRRQLEQIAEDLNTPFNGFWLDLPLETALQRTANRVYDPSDADADVLHKQREESSGVINWVKLGASAPGLADLVLASIPLDREPT
jgi:predicted kinase